MLIGKLAHFYLLLKDNAADILLIEQYNFYKNDFLL